MSLGSSGPTRLDYGCDQFSILISFIRNDFKTGSWSSGYLQQAKLAEVLACLLHATDDVCLEIFAEDVQKIGGSNPPEPI